MANLYPFRWVNRIAWRSLGSAAVVAAAFALAAGGAFSWWRLLLALVVGGAALSFELGGEHNRTRSLGVLLGLGGVCVIIFHVKTLAILFPVPLFTLFLIFWVLLFLCFGVIHVFFKGGGIMANVVALCLVFFSTFMFFTLFIPLSALSLSFSLVLTLGLFLTVAFPAGEILASAGGGMARRAARLAGYAVGFLSAEAAFLLTFSSLSPFRLSLFLTFAVILFLRMVGGAAKGAFSARAALWEFALFLAFFASFFLLGR